MPHLCVLCSLPFYSVMHADPPPLRRNVLYLVLDDARTSLGAYNHAAGLQNPPHIR